MATVVSMAMTTRNVPAGELSPVHWEVLKHITGNLYLGAVVSVWDVAAGAQGRDAGLW